MTIHANPDANGLTAARDCLASGGVVLLPTDTVMGLAALPARADATDRLFALKDRPRARNLPIMVARAGQLAILGIAENPAIAALLASPHVPGALTIAAGLGPDRPDWLAGRDEIAFRIPDDPFLRALMDMTGPLLVTSANRSGLPTPATSAEAVDQLTGSPDLVIAGRARGDAPSTLVNCRLDPPRIERYGAIAEPAIRDLLE